MITPLLSYTEHSVHPPPPPTPPFLLGRVEPPTKFSKREGLRGLQLWEGVAGKEGVTFFRRGGSEGCNFRNKKLEKTEIFNDKKSL